MCDEKVFIEKGILEKKEVSHVSSGSVGSGGKVQEITNTLHPSKASFENIKCFDDFEAVKLSMIMKCKEVAVGEKQKRRRKNKKTICQKQNKIKVKTKTEN